MNEFPSSYRFSFLCRISDSFNPHKPAANPLVPLWSFPLRRRPSNWKRIQPRCVSVLSAFRRATLPLLVVTLLGKHRANVISSSKQYFSIQPHLQLFSSGKGFAGLPRSSRCTSPLLSFCSGTGPAPRPLTSAGRPVQRTCGYRPA